MATIQSLSDISLQHICADITKNFNVNKTAAEMAVALAKKKAGVGKDNDKTFSAAVRVIVEKILDLTMVPDQLKVKIALSVMKSSEDMLLWAVKLTKILSNPSKENINYCVEKTIVTPKGDIDENKTILKVLFDSYLGVQIKWQEASYFCCFEKTTVRKYVKSQRYLKNKSMINVVKAKAQQNHVYNVWLRKYSQDMGIMQVVFGQPLTRTNLYIYVATHAPVSVLDYFTRKLPRLKRQRMLCVVLSLILEGEKGFDNLLLIHERMDKDLWFMMARKYFQKLFLSLFIMKKIECFLDDYDILCNEVDTKTCGKFLMEMCYTMNLFCIYGDVNKMVHYMKLRELFLNVWFRTPSIVKLDIILELRELLCELLNKNHFDLISCLINDSAFSLELRKEFAAFVLLNLVEYEDRRDQFLETLPEDLSEDAIKSSITPKLLKDVISEYIHYCSFEKLVEFVFGSKKQSDDFTLSAFRDKDFVVNFLSTIPSEADKFLTWGFKNEQVLKDYYEGNILTSEWVIDVYRKLMESHKPIVDFDYVSNFELYFIKKSFFKDTSKLYPILDRILEERPSLIVYLAKSISYDNRHDYGQKLLYYYLYIEGGTKHLCRKFVTDVDIKNSILYYRCRLEKLLKNIFKFKKHWMPFPHFTFCFIAELEKHKHFIISEFEKNCENTVFLPHESKEQYRLIVNVNFRLLISILKTDLFKRDLLDMFQGLYNCNLSEYSKIFSLKSNLGVMDVIPEP